MTSLTSDSDSSEFGTFDRILKIIPTCHLFLNESHPNEAPPPDWKKSVMTSIEPHLPRNFKHRFEHQNVEDFPTNFFTCRKSVFKEALAVVEFSGKAAQICGLIQTVSTSLFQLVEQHPQAGNLTRISALFRLGIKLTQNVPWSENESGLVKSTGVNIMDMFRKILKDVKGFRNVSEGLADSVRKVVDKTKKVFKTGPYPYNTEEERRIWPKNLNSFQESDVKVGLTRANDLVIASGMLSLDKMKVTLKLGMLIMILQHTKEILANAVHKVNQGHDLLRNLNCPPKWNRVTSFQLSVFELALLRKSNVILTSSADQLKDLSLLLNHNSKSLYDLRHPFKILKKDLISRSHYTAGMMVTHSNPQLLMFQIHLDQESRLKEYLRVDCLNEDAAKYLIQNFGLNSNP